MSGRAGVKKKRGWSNKPSARTVWRCPACGDQTLQGAKGGTCGPCFLNGATVKLVEGTREVNTQPMPWDTPEGLALTARVASEWYGKGKR